MNLKNTNKIKMYLCVPTWHSPNGTLALWVHGRSSRALERSRKLVAVGGRPCFFTSQQQHRAAGREPSKRIGIERGAYVPLTRYSYGEWGSVVTEIRSCASVVLPHLRQQTNDDVVWCG